MIFLHLFNLQCIKKHNPRVPLIWPIYILKNRSVRKLNQRAACITVGRSVGADDFCTLLSWPNLQARCNCLRSVLVCKSLHGTLNSLFFNRIQIWAWHRDLLHLPLAKTPKYHGNFRFSGVCTFNALPLSIQFARNFNYFRVQAKHHFKRHFPP